MSTPTKVAIVCTGRETHKRYKFNDVTVTDDQLHPNALRQTVAPELAELVDVGGAKSVGYEVVRAYNPRFGAAGWRWQCPICKLDLQFTDDGRVREWLSAAGRVADISRRS